MPPRSSAGHWPGRSTSNIRSECNRRRVAGAAIYYVSQRGFTGTDSVQAETYFPNGVLWQRSYNTNLQNHRLVIASSAPTEAVDPPWMKQPESERIFFLVGSEWPSGRIFTLSFFLGGEADEAIQSPRHELWIASLRPQ